MCSIEHFSPLFTTEAQQLRESQISDAVSLQPTNEPTSVTHFGHAARTQGCTCIIAKEKTSKILKDSWSWYNVDSLRN